MLTVRFAPAPSGKLHLGNLRVLLVNCMICNIYCLEKTILLRIDFQADTTVVDENNTIKSVENIIRIFELDTFLKISIQRDRFERYFEVFNILKNNQYVYFLNGVYYLDIKKDYKDKIHVVRFNDLLLGRMYKSISFINNPVIYSDNKKCFFYNFMSVIDDIDFNIKYIARGNDHLDNTYIQILMFEKIICVLEKKYTIPLFIHIPMCVSRYGKISKSKGVDISIENCLSKMFFPKVIKDYLLEKKDNIKNIGRSQKTIDMQNLEKLNLIYLNKTNSLLISEQLLKIWNISIDVNLIECFKFFIKTANDLVEIDKKIKSFYSKKFNIKPKEKKQIKILYNENNQQNLYDFVGEIFGYKYLGKEIINYIGIDNIVK